LATDKPLKVVPIPLTGKLNTAEDPSTLGKGDFSQLVNMRYGELNPKSVSGMTKINTSVINSTYFKPRAGFHFRKDQPSESHVLVQAFNTGETASRVYENTTAIPSAGNFTATQVWSDTSGAGYGKFSKAPDGCMAYCNGKDSCIWGGTEYRCAKFVIGDSSAANLYDYTEVVNNTLTDTNNIATMSSVSTTFDAYDKAVYHFDNAATDATTNTYNLTASGITYSNAIYKFATHSAVFDGAAGYFTLAHATYDADFTGKVWTIDAWVRLNSLSGTQTIYSQATDADNYFKIGVTSTGKVFLSIYDTASEVVLVETAVSSVTTATWYHIEVSQNSDANYYIFINGVLLAYSTDANNPADYTGAVNIGAMYNGATRNEYLDGYIDELRISLICRHTSNFVVRTNEYGASSTTCYNYIGSTRPIQGIKYYVGTANGTSATAQVYYWASAAWNAVSSQSDGTATTGVTLAQTGTISFTSTVSTAKPKVIDGLYLYWYLVIFSGIDSTTTVSQCSVDAPMQDFVDIWDGVPVSIASAISDSGSVKTDVTTKILYEDYVSTSATTFVNLGAATGTPLYIGFTQRMSGIKFNVVSDQVNTNPLIMTVKYWNGSAWTTCSNLNDNTRVGSNPLGQSGWITWDSPNSISEHQTSFLGGEKFYYYGITFSSALDAAVHIDYVQGLSAPKDILAYEIPVMWQDRIWLLNESSNKRNKAVCSASGTVCVFNGADSGEFLIGDESKITGAGTLFTRFGGTIYDNLIITKVNGEVWLIDGTTPQDYKQYKIADNSGCVAPGTFKMCSLGYEIAPSITKHVAVWQSSGAIVMFDGNSLMAISKEIENYFDPTKSECINSSYIHKSEAFYDDVRQEYHWVFYSGSTPDKKEFVYDLIKKKWFEIQRGTGKELVLGFTVIDTNGKSYSYGAIDTGYVERLEYGTTFDGTSITRTFKTGDVALSGWGTESTIHKIRHIARAKTTTTNSVTITHYVDGITTSADTTATGSLSRSGYDKKVSTPSVTWTPGLFHSIKCSLITTNENIGYEPIGLVLAHKDTHEMA
jgi:hypothetical protein